MNERTPLTVRRNYGATTQAAAKPAAAPAAPKAPAPKAAAGKQATEAPAPRPAQDETSIMDYFTVSFWVGAAKNQAAQAEGYAPVSSNGPGNGK